MYYPGDTIPFLISLARADAAAPVVTTPPQIAILKAADNSAMDVSGVGIKSAAMTLVPGTDALYKYLWNSAGAANVVDGGYVAVVSYVVDGLTVNSRLLTAFQLGDSRLQARVAEYSTAAKTTDVPDKTTVFLKTDFVAPSADASIVTILAKINGLPANVADQATLLQTQAAVSDLHDAVLGSWSINKAVSPNILTLYKLDGSVLQSFTLISNSSTATRTRS